MSLYDSLLAEYGYNAPIFSNEIVFEEYSRPWIYKELNRLCEEKVLVRFEKGTYYIPEQTLFGNSVMNPRKVIEKKYIQSKQDVFGYYSGCYLLNQLGLTNQMPNLIEIYTNNESSKARDILVGTQTVRLKKARTKITAENARVLVLMEIMNIIDLQAFNQEKRRVIIEYILKNKISRRDISMYAPVFPDKAMRALIESEVIYSVAQ